MKLDVPDELRRGRECYARRAWADAYRSLSLADQVARLEAQDLELLAMSAYLIGRDDDYLRALERAHYAHLDARERLGAVRCAFWLWLRLIFRGETGRATGWLARAQRLLEPEEPDCAERGYLLLAAVEQHLAAGDCEAAYAAAAAAVEIGERCGEADLIACARHDQGRIRLQQGQVERGLALLDEVMVAATAGELSSIVTGLMYCSVIQACQEVYAFGRAREWTVALAQWCEEQPEMVAFTGVCRVHRAEIMQLRGAWQDAIEEARRARERFAGGLPAGRRRGVLPTSGGAPSPRGIRGGRGGVSKREPVRLGNTAGAGPVARRARPLGCGRRRNSPCPERHERPAQAHANTACLRRDHARRGRRPGSAHCLPRSWRRSPRASIPAC